MNITVIEYFEAFRETSLQIVDDSSLPQKYRLVGIVEITRSYNHLTIIKKN